MSQIAMFALGQMRNLAYRARESDTYTCIEICEEKGIYLPNSAQVSWLKMRGTIQCLSCYLDGLAFGFDGRGLYCN